MRSIDTCDPGRQMYRVNEIFYSLQGEGHHTGTPAVFVRLSGCNLKCPFCDTRHHDGTMMSTHDIVAAVTSYPCSTVILTGGEPSLWPLDPLVCAMHAAGRRVHVETNGTNPLPGSIDWITCSPKQGGEVVITRIDEIKIVYTGGDVESIADALIATLGGSAPLLYLQPCSGRNTGEVIDYILAHPRWRLSLQTHLLTGIR